MDKINIFYAVLHLSRPVCNKETGALFIFRNAEDAAGAMQRLIRQYPDKHFEVIPVTISREDA